MSIDETNADTRYRRNAVRRLLAATEASARGSIRAIARSAAVVAEDKALLDAVAAAAWKRCRNTDGRGLRAADLRKLPTALLRRVLRFEVKRVGGLARDFSYAHCAAIARALQERRGGTFHAGAARVRLSAGRLIVSDASHPVVESAPLTFAVPAESARFDWSGGCLELRTRRRAPHPRIRAGTLRLDGDALTPGTPLTLRRPQNGDRFVPSGRRSDVSLARFLAKAGVSAIDRSDVPLLCKNGAIIAVLGVRSAADYVARPGARTLEVAWTAPNAPQADVRADV